MFVTLVKLECLWCLVCGKSHLILPFLREFLAYWVVVAPLKYLKCIVSKLQAAD